MATHAKGTWLSLNVTSVQAIYETNTFLSFNRKASEAKNRPWIDITAGSSYGDETFQFTKETIAEVFTEYGTDKIRYGLIVFGNTATVKIQFINVTVVDDLVNHLDVRSWTQKAVLPWTITNDQYEKMT